MSRSSSEVLEERFGPTRLEILYQDTDERVICTRTVRGDKVLELSWVSFRPAGIGAFRGIHHRIVRGESMGKAFAAAGVEFHREVRGSYHVNGGVPAIFRERFDSEAAPTVTEVTIKVGPHALAYADILEVYHPSVPAWENAGRTRQPDTALLSRLEAFAAKLKAATDKE